MAKYADDFLLLLGAVLIVYGTFKINPTTAIFVAGVFCIIAGILIGLKDGDS